MENDLIQPIHFEFYGLSGAGKSYISHFVAIDLRNKGYKVIEPTYDIVSKNNLIIRRIKKVLITFVFIIFNYNKSKEIIKLIKKNSYYGKDLFRQMINIIPKINIYQKAKKGYIYIWDEGIVQSSISLSFFNNINPENNFNKLCVIIGKDVIIKKILIKVSKKLAFQRMDERKTNDSRIEKVKLQNSANKMILKMEKLVLSIKNKDIIVNNNSSNFEKVKNDIINYIIKILK